MEGLLPFLRSCTDSAMLVLIWLVQLVIYPAFRDIEPTAFITWHRKYVRTIGYIVIPLMLIQAANIATQLFLSPGPILIGSAVAVLTAWLVTFGISVPCHRTLQEVGKDGSVIHRLIATNWLRTAGWSLAWLLNLWEQVAS